VVISALGLTGAGPARAAADCTLAPIQCFAISETTEAGTVTSGSFADTDVTDDVFESFSEQDATIGPPPKRADLLQHTWTIEVQAGNSYSFAVDAYRVDAGGEGDDFKFMYSADGGQNWATMVIVDRDSLATYAYDFTTDVAGTVLVRAEDADRGQANKTHASLYVDALYVGVSDADPPPPPSISERNIIGYYTSWSIYDRDYFVNEHDPGVDHIPADKLTHINYAFANTAQDGTILIGDAFADINKAFGNEPAGAPYKGNFQQLQILKQNNPHIKTFISVGGWTWSDHFSDIMANSPFPNSRQTFCDSLLDFVTTYGFDGADIDWEYPGDPGEGDNSFRDGGVDAQNFVATLALCKPLFEFEDKLLTLATPCNPALYQHPSKGGELDLAALEPLVDWVNLLSYDLHGAFDPVTGHQSQLYLNPHDPYAGDPIIRRFTQDACVRGHIAEGMPAEKIHLGVPFYGRSFARVQNALAGGVLGLFQPFDGVPKGTWDGGRWGVSGVFDYEDIVLNILPGATPAYDTISEVPTLTWALGRKKGLGFMSYDDRTSVCNKAAYADDENLAGLMFWELSGDIEDHPESLVNAMFCGLNPGAAGCAGVCPAAP
jgi:GH18 family chitinase